MSSWRENGGRKEYITWNYRKVNKNNFNRYSAGILPYTKDSHGNILFLLGKDKEGDWSDFGGRCEFKDRTDEKNTASREFYEETFGAIMNIQESLERLITNEYSKVISKTLNGSPYYMFLIKIDYLNYTDSFNKTSNFLKYHFSQNYNDRFGSNKIFEKNDIRWINSDTLLNCTEKQKLIPLRNVFLKTIEQYKDKINELVLQN